MQRGQDFVNVMEVARAERQLSRSEAVFVDVGAGIGWFSMLLAANGCASACDLQTGCDISSDDRRTMSE